jgi:hypothetical protein
LLCGAVGAWWFLVGHGFEFSWKKCPVPMRKTPGYGRRRGRTYSLIRTPSVG